MISENLQRRQLTESQRASVAARLKASFRSGNPAPAAGRTEKSLEIPVRTNLSERGKAGRKWESAQKAIRRPWINFSMHYAGTVNFKSCWLK
jgi:hypothetical protein